MSAEWEALVEAGRDGVLRALGMEQVGWGQRVEAYGPAFFPCTGAESAFVDRRSVPTRHGCDGCEARLVVGDDQ